MRLIDGRRQVLQSLWVSCLRPILVLVLVGMFAEISTAEEIGVRIRVGLADTAPTTWVGKLEHPNAELFGMAGWRPTMFDLFLPETQKWKIRTRARGGGIRSNHSNEEAAASRFRRSMLDNGVMLGFRGVKDATGARLTLKGEPLWLPLAGLPYGEIREVMDGQVEFERTAASAPFAATEADEDFPAAALGAGGRVHVTWTRHVPGVPHNPRIVRFSEAPEDFGWLAAEGGGDQVWLRSRVDGAWQAPLAITEPGRDVFRSAVAEDGAGRVWVLWSEQVDGNFDIFARSVRDGRAGTVVRLTTDPGNDLSPVAVADAAGRVWVAWQGARGGRFQILARRQGEDDEWLPESVVSDGPGNSWAPAIAAQQAGSSRPGGETPHVVIAWDTYARGDYDVRAREYDLSGKANPTFPVAASNEYEARPTVTWDHFGNLWFAWEEGGPSWGKDWGLRDQDKDNTPLYRYREIGLAVRAPDGSWSRPAGDLEAALPGNPLRRSGPPARIPAREPGGEPQAGAESARARPGFSFENLSRLATDASGRIWLLVRSREASFVQKTPLWLEWASFYDGTEWVGPILLPHSDNLLYSQPAVVAPPEDGLLVFLSTDHRQAPGVRRVDEPPPGVGKAVASRFTNDVYRSRLAPPEGKLKEWRLLPAEREFLPLNELAPGVAAERAAIEGARAQRIQLRGEELRLLRGEFHRHTEVSGDGARDGAIEDMWRYGLDAAGLDYLGNGDHDFGNSYYWWWLIQKTTDAYVLDDRFTSLFSYERSLPWPEGHRNVVFPRRGIRPLPRLPLSNPAVFAPAPDTEMLYRFLRQFGAISSPHTSATSMGTDWRNHDPEVEPIVEIYQGARESYERADGPRAPRSEFAGWAPKYNKGFVNEALNAGHRLGFQSSSDHASTHISYAMVWVPDFSRDAVLEAMKKRRIYAATDNIIADVREVSGAREHFMGEEFPVTGSPRLRVELRGTDAFSRVVIVKDDEIVHDITPGQPHVLFEWEDPDPSAGQTSWYYVRGEQENGELVWVSPMWIRAGAASEDN